MHVCLLRFGRDFHIVPLKLFGSSSAVGSAQIFLWVGASVSHGSFLMVGIGRGLGICKDFSCPFQVALQSSDKYYVNISSPAVTFKTDFLLCHVSMF